jgi:hypothetical protein
MKKTIATTKTPLCTSDQLKTSVRTLISDVVFSKKTRPSVIDSLTSITTEFDTYLTTHRDTPPDLDPVLSFMADLLNHQPLNDRTCDAFRGRDAFLNVAYPLVRFPFEITLIDESKVRTAVAEILGHPEGDRFLSALALLFEEKSPALLSKYMAKDQDSSGWKSRVLVEYENTHKQGILRIGRYLKDNEAGKVDPWLELLAQKLNEMVACETQLVKEYIRLQVDIASELSSAELPFETQVQCRLASSLVESAVQTVLKEFIREDNMALDHHTIFKAYQILGAELMEKPESKDKYGLSPVCESIMTLPFFRKTLVSTVKTALSYSEIASVVSQDTTSASAYFGAHLQEKPVFQTYFETVGAADGGSLDASQVNTLMPAIVFHALLDTQTIQFRPSIPNTDALPKRIAVALAQMPVTELSVLGITQAEGFDYIKRLYPDIIDFVSLTGSKWVADAFIQSKGPVSEAIINNKALEIWGNTPAMITVWTLPTLLDYWGSNEKTDRQKCEQIVRLATGFPDYIAETTIFSHTVKMTTLFRRKAVKQQYILRYCQALKEGRKNIPDHLAKILQRQIEGSMRIINGGSVWAEVANMLFYPVLKNTATLLALFCIFYFGKVFLETEPVP